MSAFVRPAAAESSSASAILKSFSPNIATMLDGPFPARVSKSSGIWLEKVSTRARSECVPLRYALNCATLSAVTWYCLRFIRQSVSMSSVPRSYACCISCWIDCLLIGIRLSISALTADWLRSVAGRDASFRALLISVSSVSV